MNALRLAFGLLTAVPMGRLPEVRRRSAGAAMLLAPMTTLPVLTALVVGHLLVVRAGAPASLAAALVVTGDALVTRAMHLDGLADTADGLSAGYDARSSLRAMKASDTGPSGVAAVVCALLLQTAALSALLVSFPGLVLAAVSWVASRHVLAWLCRVGVPAAQQQGLGAMVAGSVRLGRLAVAAALVSAASLAAATVAGVVWWRMLVVLVLGIVSAALLERRCRHRLGGISGDVLGAAVEVALTASLVTAALLV